MKGGTIFGMAGTGRNRPSVSVVVPTIGRPELVRALRSARAQQTAADVEIVVVHDGGPQVELPAETHALADQVLRTPGRVGGSHARNIGIAASNGEFIALLDDDDEWLPGKTESQLDFLCRAPDPVSAVVSGRFLSVGSRNGVVSRPMPDRLIGSDERVEHYLFRRRQPKGGRPVLPTPTLMLARELALSTPWDETLARHQDWDWLVRLGRRPRTVFGQVPEVVAKIYLGSPGSVSATTDWRTSLDWATRVLRDDPATYADFLAAQPLRYALAARSWTGARAVIQALWKSETMPSAGPMVIGAAGLLPRRVIERVTVSRRG